MGGSFDPPTIGHLQLASETLNILHFDEVWIIPCGVRKDKNNHATAQQRLAMTQMAVKDYFPEEYPVYVNSIEIDNGESIPTYFLMKKLEEKYPSNDFYFIIGSDLLPGLVHWDGGENFIKECGFVLFERKGHEDKMDPNGANPFMMPPKIEIINSNVSQVGQISSTEIRNRITNAKTTIPDDIASTKKTSNIEAGSVESSASLDHYPAHIFYDIAGLCTKSTISYIREQKLY